MTATDTLTRYKQIAELLLRHRDAPKRVDQPLAGEPEVADGADSDGEQLARQLEEMGPTFIKVGQLLSTRPDLLPEDYCDALARLQDDVDPIPWDAVRERVEEELGVSINKAFADFEQEPLASASLAQVHQATLRSGRPVAVKVQRPGVREAVRSDMEALEGAVGLAEKLSDTARRLHVQEDAGRVPAHAHARARFQA